MDTFLDAVKAGDAATVDRLLTEDRSLLLSHENGVSAVMLALYHGKRDVARMLIDRGAPLSFHDLCAAGDVSRVRAMLRDDPSLLDRRSADGFPPLGLAVFFGNRDVAKFLVDEGADVNAAADNAQSVAPVHAAAAVCDHEILTVLLDRGADPNARQQNGYTALHTAAARGDIDMARLLLRHGADPSVQGSDGLSVPDLARKYGQSGFAQWWESRGAA